MPLKLRRTAEQFPKAGWPPSDNELVVMHGETVIGSLRRIDGGPQQDNWSWSITTCYVPPGVMTLHGTADSKEAAKPPAPRPCATAWITSARRNSPTTSSQNTASAASRGAQRPSRGHCLDMQEFRNHLHVSFTTQDAMER